MMQISEDTQKVMNFLIEYSNGNLRKPDDVAILLETSATYDLSFEINDLSFHSKSLWNMHKTLKRNEPNDDSITNIRKEIEKTYQIMLNLLANIVSLADEEDKSRFDQNYFQRTTGCFLNIIDLAHDFAMFKNLQIDLHHKNL